jgi:hypothetical protein
VCVGHTPNDFSPFVNSVRTGRIAGASKFGAWAKMSAPLCRFGQAIIIVSMACAINLGVSASALSAFAFPSARFLPCSLCSPAKAARPHAVAGLRGNGGLRMSGVFHEVQQSREYNVVRQATGYYRANPDGSMDQTMESILSTRMFSDDDEAEESGYDLPEDDEPYTAGRGVSRVQHFST